jgi:hypothetical protein
MQKCGFVKTGLRAVWVVADSDKTPAILLERRRWARLKPLNAQPNVVAGYFDIEFNARQTRDTFTSP